jgi:hypothetical protein
VIGIDVIYFLDNNLIYKLMKYLLGFNESSQSHIKSVCQDLLLELSDKGVDYTVHTSGRFNSDNIQISIKIGILHSVLPDNRYYFKLKQFESDFTNLVNFLEEEGFQLEDSYVNNDKWAHEERCPSCNGKNVRTEYDNLGVYNSHCRKCEYEGPESDFLNPNHPIESYDDLLHMIKLDFEIQYMVLNFYI